jgi:hypothetical protein
MKLPGLRRIFETDFSADDKELIKGLSIPINNGMEVLYDALNGKITLTDNIACTLKQVDVQVDSSGLVKGTASFALNNTNQVVGTQVIEAISLSSPAVFPTGGIFITGAQTERGYTIQHVTGLPANSIFRLRVIAWNS